MFEFTIGLIIIYENRLIADKDQNNIHVNTLVLFWSLLAINRFSYSFNVVYCKHLNFDPIFINTSRLFSFTILFTLMRKK